MSTVTPLAVHPFAPKGYIHNKRGFAVTKNGTRDIAYVLAVQSSRNGIQLCVETLIKEGPNQEFTTQGIWYPVIPYRVIIGDPSTLNSLNANGWAPQDTGTSLFFNPGVTMSAGKPTNLPTLGYNAAQPYYQLNLTRSQLESINNQPKILMRKQTVPNLAPAGTWVGSNMFADCVYGLTITADDTRASIIARNIDEYTDELFISVTATITLQGSFLEGEVLSNNSIYQKTAAVPKVYSYSLPVLLRFYTSRSAAFTGNIMPLDWRYLFPVSDWAAADSVTKWGVSRINPQEVGSFTSASWNYNLIPSKKIEESRSYTIISNLIIVSEVFRSIRLFNFGCMWDVVYDSTNDRLLAMSAIGNWHQSRGVAVQEVYNLSFDRSSFLGGYASETVKIDQGDFGPGITTSHLNGEYNPVGNNAMFAFSAISSGGKFIGLYYWNNSAVPNVFAHIGGGGACGVAKQSDTFILSCAGTEQSQGVVVLKCPAASIMNAWTTWNKSLALIMTGHHGFTLLGALNWFVVGKYDPIPGDQSSNLGITTLYYDISGDDKSIFPTLQKSPFAFVRFPIVFYDTLVETVMPNIFTGKYIFYQFRTDLPGNSVGNATGFASDNCSGFDSTDFFRLYMDGNKVKIQGFDTQVLNINGTPSMAYYGNPTFGYKPGQGVFSTLVLSNCSGVFRKGTGGTGDWSTSLGGVPVDPVYTRPDLDLVVAGNYSGFIASNGVGNYWAALVKPTWKLEMTYGGKQLVVNNGLSTAFADYTVSGICSLHTHTYLDLEGVLDSLGRPYTDTNFELLNVAYTLTINTTPRLVAQGTVDINPPNPNGSIDASVYKTVSDSVMFTMSRDAETSMYDITTRVNDVVQSVLPNYNQASTTTSASIPIATSNLKKGDHVSVYYRPLYRDSRGPDTPVSSRKVTVVKGHKYYLENVSIWIDGLDKTSEISQSSTPYLYVNPGAGTANVGVIFDVKHEDFPNEAYPSAQSYVYPFISNTYMLILPVQYYPPIENGTVLEEVPPIGSPSTYPNGSYAMANKIYNLYAGASFKDTASHDGESIIELSTETLTANVSSGSYHIYIVVEDEFGQRSVWCVTNVSKNYRIPFRRT